MVKKHWSKACSLFQEENRRLQKFFLNLNGIDKCYLLHLQLNKQTKNKEIGKGIALQTGQNRKQGMV